MAPDPIALEIHRQALQNIVNEMGLTLVRTSGSPVVNYSMDFSTCLLEPDGQQIGLVAYMLKHSASSWLGTRALVQQLRAQGRAPEPGEGWLVNDPYEGGAMHQGDVAVIMPQFFAGEHVGWAFTVLHVLDIGGSGLSGFNPAARTVFDEGLRFPMLRMIRDGRLEDDWERYIAGSVRVPGPVLNDIRGMIASNQLAEAKLAELLERVGVDTHREYCEHNAALTERVLRGRIGRIPDGIYRSVDWSEFDGHDGPDRLLEVRLELEVAGDELRFRFSGPPQVDSYMNSGVGAMHGATMTAVMTTLGYGDLPFNAGMWRPLTLDLGPRGTLINAIAPAPVSATHAETGLIAIKLVKATLSQALALSDDPELRARCAGQAQDGAGSTGVSGINQHGTTSVVYYLDPSVGQGGGAQTIMDGQDSYGSTIMVGCGMADVEAHEADDPVLFLWRRILPNSGGPGQWRGGQGVDQAFCLLYADELRGWARTQCAETPPRGFGGGLPGSASRVVPLRDTNVLELLDAGVHPHDGRLRASAETIRNKQVPFALRRGDVIRFVPGGGGGLGDPLLRDPDLVAADVGAGFVTPGNARATYGVVLDGAGGADAAATAQARAALRRERLGADPAQVARPPEIPGVAVRRTANGGPARWTCASCSADLGDAAQDWRAAAVARRTPIAEAFGRWEMRVRERTEAPGVLLEERFCPACAGALEVEVVLDGPAAG